MFDTLGHGREGVQPRASDRTAEARHVPLADLRSAGSEERRWCPQRVAARCATTRMDEATTGEGRPARTSSRASPGRQVVPGDPRADPRVKEHAVAMAQ